MQNYNKQSLLNYIVCGSIIFFEYYIYIINALTIYAQVKTNHHSFSKMVIDIVLSLIIMEGAQIESLSYNKINKCLNCASSLNNNYYSTNFCSGQCKDACIRHRQE